MSEVGTITPHNSQKPHVLVDSINNNNNNKDPRKTTQISEPRQGGGIFTKFCDSLFLIGREIGR